MKRTYTTRYRKQIKRLLCILFVPVLLAGAFRCLALAEEEESEFAGTAEGVEDAKPEEAGGLAEPEDGAGDPTEPEDGAEDLAEPEDGAGDPTEPGEDCEPASTANEPVYTGVSATSVTVTGTYNLDGRDCLDAWLEKSTTGMDADFETIGGTNDGSAVVTFHESDTLTPNTTYWYRTYIETDSGAETSEASSFTTLPRVDTVNTTPTEPTAGIPDALPPGSAAISGSIALGSEAVSDVVITWAGDAAFTQNAQTINGSSGVTHTNAAYAADITGLTAGETYYVKVEAVGPGGTSEPATSSFTAAGSMLQMFSIPIGTDGIIVENEAEFRSALTNAAYKTIYLGADITMSSGYVTIANRPLEINGTDPREGGTRHKYTDYRANTLAAVSIRGAGTDVTFKDIDVYINNQYGIYNSTVNGETVIFDGVTGQSGSFFNGYGDKTTLVIKDCALTLGTTNDNTRELAASTGTVRFEGKVAVKRVNATANNIYLFNLTGSASAIEIAAGADVTLDNTINTTGTNRTVFYGATKLTVGEGAVFACYSGQAFCTNSSSSTFTNVTIGRGADVRLIHTGASHSKNSFYGTTNSTFQMEEGSSFLLYDSYTDATYSICDFTNIRLNNPERFIMLSPSTRVTGSTYSPVLTATGVSSIRYYPSAQIASLFDTGTYVYTPTRSYTRWWAQSSPFYVTADTWSASSPRLFTDYSSAKVPTASATVTTSLTTGNFPAGSGVYGVEICGRIYTVTYDGNGAGSGTVPASDAGVPNDRITVQGNTGSLARTGYTFAGWNTAADGSGTSYPTGGAFIITGDTTLYAQWLQNSCTVSGSVSGHTDNSGVTIRYTIDSGGAQIVPTDSSGYYSITGVPRGSTVVITPPAQTNYTVSPTSRTVSGITADSTGNDFSYTRNFYVVTEKYVNELTGEEFQSDTYSALMIPAPPYTYSGSLDNVVAGGEIYIYQGYKIGSYTPGDMPDNSGRPTISVLAADKTVYLIYHKVNGAISVTFPTGNNWDFYVNRDTYPYVETGAMGGTGGYYSFENESDKPVAVDLTEVYVISDGGLSLVADASASPPGSGEYSLELLPAATALTGAANGFANTVTGITPGTHTTMRLGALDGRYVRQAAPTSTKGYVTIGGYYAGYLSRVEKNPRLALTFTFSLL